jgi:hypothetical protein
MRERRLLLILFAIALLPRLLFLFETTRSPLFNFLSLDAKSYDSWGMEIASALSEAPFHMALYPTLLGFSIGSWPQSIDCACLHLRGAVRSRLHDRPRLLGGDSPCLRHSLGYPSSVRGGPLVVSVLSGLSLQALWALVGERLFGRGPFDRLGRGRTSSSSCRSSSAGSARERGAAAAPSAASEASPRLIPTTVHNYRVSGDLI